MERMPRTFRCKVCGYEQEINTNHEGECFDYCHGCSWKSYGFDNGENSAQMFGHTHRRFEFVKPSES